MSRVFNFSAGPAVLPVEVLEEARDDLLDYKGSGMSIMESSHRGKEYDAVHQEAIANVRKLLDVGDDYAVLLLQGGASGQFAMAPMNLRRPGELADYVNSGAWASKAIKEARILGDTRVAADTSAATPATMPSPSEFECSDRAAYLHITSNETIGGIQWKSFDGIAASAPLVADMSSDILSRPFDIRRFGLVYAGAQKNLGPSGVTLVIIREDLAERVPDTVPAVLRYSTHIAKNSLYNTPPCFAIYILQLVTRWIDRNGGLEGVAATNARKASKIYAAIDAGEFYCGTASVDSRSDMNVTFRLPSEELERDFVSEAARNDLEGLKGHRDVGGIRASIYNAFPEAGVDALCEFMRDFERARG